MKCLDYAYTHLTGFCCLATPNGIRKLQKSFEEGEICKDDCTHTAIQKLADVRRKHFHSISVMCKWSESTNDSFF